MRAWREVSLGEGLKVRHGYAFKGEHFKDHGDLIVLTPGNFIDGGGFKSKSGAEKYYDGLVPPGYLLSKGNVVVAMTEQSLGLLGSSATIPSDDRYLHNQRIGLLEIVDPEILDLRFVYHLMNSPDVRRQIQATATGTKVRHTAPERIRAVETRLPPLDVQRTIAAVLDWLDDLIENNRRRVEVLEEMARAIYREWFVHFRYPGHENAALVDSPIGLVPAAWNLCRLDQACSFIDGKPISKEERAGGPVIVYGANGPIGFTERAPRFDECTVMGKIGSCGSLHRSNRPSWVSNNAFGVLPGRWRSRFFIWLALLEIDFRPLIGGAANPYLPRQNFGHLTVVQPPDSLIDQFHQLVHPMFGTADSLDHQVETLVSLRDRLLPRLITGEIDISSLDLDALVEEPVA
jgi:type I restriction enzyme S subunit